MTLTDFEVIMDISLDEAVACTVEDCEVEASWRVIISCCKSDFNLCDPHYQNTRNFLNSRRSDEQGICAYCGGKVNPLTWVYRVHPI